MGMVERARDVDLGGPVGAGAIDGVLDQSLQVSWHNFRVMLAGKELELVNDVSPATASINDRTGCALQCPRIVRCVAEQARVSENDGEKVVEVMGHAPCEGCKALKFSRLAQPGIDAPTFGQVAQRQQAPGLLGEADIGDGDFRGETASIRTVEIKGLEGARPNCG